MSDDNKSRLTTAFLAPGDGLRDVWASLPRAAKWAVGAPLFLLLALLPLHTPAILDTPGVSFGGTMAQLDKTFPTMDCSI